MKLPEYRNDKPLYQQQDNSEWEDLKFTVLGFGIPIALVACIGFIIFRLFA